MRILRDDNCAICDWQCLFLFALTEEVIDPDGADSQIKSRACDLPQLVLTLVGLNSLIAFVGCLGWMTRMSQTATHISPEPLLVGTSLQEKSKKEVNDVRTM